MPTRSTGLVFDERFLSHDTGAQASVVMRSGSFLVDPEQAQSVGLVGVATAETVAAAAGGALVASSPTAHPLA